MKNTIYTTKTTFKNGRFHYVVTDNNGNIIPIELIFEKGKHLDKREIYFAYHDAIQIKNNQNIESILSAMQKLTNVIEVNVGRGGHHIWISNPNGERLAIIEFK